MVITSALHAEGPRFEPGQSLNPIFVCLTDFSFRKNLKEKCGNAFKLLEKTCKSGIPLFNKLEIWHSLGK